MKEPKDPYIVPGAVNLSTFDQFPCAFASSPEGFGACAGTVMTCTWEPVYDEEDNLVKAGLAMRMCEFHHEEFNTHMASQDSVWGITEYLREQVVPDLPEQRDPLWDRRN